MILFEFAGSHLTTDWPRTASDANKKRKYFSPTFLQA
jgi:hypothetical protein